MLLFNGKLFRLQHLIYARLLCFDNFLVRTLGNFLGTEMGEAMPGDISKVSCCFTTNLGTCSWNKCVTKMMSIQGLGGVVCPLNTNAYFHALNSAFIRSC